MLILLILLILLIVSTGMEVAAKSASPIAPTTPVRARAATLTLTRTSQQQLQSATAEKPQKAKPGKSSSTAGNADMRRSSTASASHASDATDASSGSSSTSSNSLTTRRYVVEAGAGAEAGTPPSRPSSNRTSALLQSPRVAAGVGVGVGVEAEAEAEADTKSEAIRDRGKAPVENKSDSVLSTRLNDQEKGVQREYEVKDGLEKSGSEVFSDRASAAGSCALHQAWLCIGSRCEVFSKRHGELLLGVVVAVAEDGSRSVLLFCLE